ncbi:MAG: Asp-tRNA(Asn)/Glu-tRNA(Gln) amidotransferase subunit GatA [Saprospiraceae bacterium]
MPKYSNLQAIQSELKAGSTSCEKLVDYYLTQIEQQLSLNIYVETYAEEARARAKALDQKYQEDPMSVGPLFGMVVSIKDVLCYKDHKLSAGSKMLHNFTSSFSATAIERILAADAIIIGRTNCDEFAMGSTNENSYYGPTRNAIDPTRVPGGSSGGSAVSVQADTCLAALGSDTGGSVRQPASFCGLVGMKPSYGRISRYGLLAYASSFDQIGILANSVADTAILLEVMAGADEFDSTVSAEAVPAYSQHLTFSGRAKVAYIEEAMQHKGLDPEIKKQSFHFIEELRSAGHQVEAVDFEYLAYLVPSYYVLTMAEASSNLSRYDGVRYGHRTETATSLEEHYRKSRTEGFGEEVKRRIMLGTFVLSVGYYDAYFKKAQQARRLIQQRIIEVLEDYDFIIMPVTPSVAWKIGAKQDNPVEVYLSDIYTVLANLTGMPAIAFPLGKNKNGIPFGIQLMSAKFTEKNLLSFANTITQNLS